MDCNKPQAVGSIDFRTMLLLIHSKQKEKKQNFLTDSSTAVQLPSERQLFQF